MKNNSIYAGAQMLIRKPVAQVFEALINPEITTKFWFTHSTGKLITGETVTWKWEMYNAEAVVKIKEIVPNQKINIEWGEPATTIEFNFEALSDNTTYLDIKNYGFNQTGDELIGIVRDSTGGFTTMIDALKAYLEHGIQLGLVGDKFAKGK